MTAVSDFFAALYGNCSQPVLVTDGENNRIYANPKMAELAASMNLLLEEVLTSAMAKEGEKCLAECRCGELSCAVGGQTLNLSITPYPYKDQQYLVYQPVREPTPLNGDTALIIYRSYHEKINSLLNEIYGTARLVERDDERGKEISDAVRRMVRVNGHLYEMLDGAGKNRYLVPMDLQSLIETYADAYNEIEPRAKIRCLPSDEQVYAMVMPEDLEIILGNLFSNALRFCRDRVTVWTERKGERVSIVVADNGSGAEDPKQLFTVGYSRPDRKGVKGIGFGLYTAKKLAELQGATLHYERRGENTCFRFETDAVDLPQGRLAEWTAEDAGNSLSQIRIEMSDYVKELEL